MARSLVTMKVKVFAQAAREIRTHGIRTQICASWLTSKARRTTVCVSLGRIRPYVCDNISRHNLNFDLAE
jgi:hypothetical protein